ncbi:hypothetical protein CKO28_05055 [Rhodovibrio sodomensis]|uniref:Uncharacterized protein n=1 Tax=Rhodovibrio sodomensis TaxID=1088 RepID=A0ABS1DB98_9PROT|nr:hypothetical protein [Rhodovibrio sodomensis]MBK1667397.1 hypothetical protein [Rhodovibrio sodomensis]
MAARSLDHKAAVAAAMDIAFFTCQDKPMPFWPENLHISDADAEDAHAPFMTEAMLYGLLGKEDARSLLNRFRTLMTALGYPEESQHWLLNEAYETRVRTTFTLKIERGPAYDTLKQAIRNQGSILKHAGSPRIDGSELVFKEITHAQEAALRRAIRVTGYPHAPSVQCRRFLTSRDLAELNQDAAPEH